MSGLLALLALLGATACGQTPSAGLPVPVTTALAALTEECTDAGGIPHDDNAVQRADLNGDAQDDFVLFTGWIECENAASIYGDREKGVTVFAGDGHGQAAETFSDAVYAAMLEKSGDATALWLTTSAEGCGKARAEFFSEETFCDRAIVWNRPEARFEYAPVSTVRIIK